MVKTGKAKIPYKIIVSIIIIIIICGVIGVLINKSDSGKVKITLPKVSSEREATEKAGAFAVKQYIYARMKTEELIEYDLKNGSVSELSNMVEETLEAWQVAEVAASRTEEVASISDNPITSLDTTKMLYTYHDLNLLGTVSYAAEENAATKWAEDISKKFDSYPANQRIKSLAQDLGTDAKNAYKQLQLAQNILKGDAERDEGDLYKLVEDSLLATKTACKVGFFACGTVATGGILNGYLEAGAYIVSGVDVVIDMSSTGSTIILGDNHNVSIAFNKVKDCFAPISSTMGLLTFSGGNIADKLSYIGDSALDFCQEKKILGGLIKFDEDNDTTTITTVEVDTTNKSPEEIKKELEEANIPIPSEENNKTAKEVVKKLEEEMHTDISIEEANKFFDNLLAELEKTKQEESKEKLEETSENEKEATKEEPLAEGVPKAEDIVGIYNISGISSDSMFGDSDFSDSYEFYFDNKNNLHWVSSDALTQQKIDLEIKYNIDTGIANYSDGNNGVSTKSTFKFQLENGNVKLYFERLLELSQLGTDTIQAEGFKQ